MEKRDTAKIVIQLIHQILNCLSLIVAIFFLDTDITVLNQGESKGCMFRSGNTFAKWKVKS